MGRHPKGASPVLEGVQWVWSQEWSLGQEAQGAGNPKLMSAWGVGDGRSWEHACPMEVGLCSSGTVWYIGSAMHT